MRPLNRRGPGPDQSVAWLTLPAVYIKLMGQKEVNNIVLGVGIDTKVGTCSYYETFEKE
jgi:hypothetical protein